MQTVKIIIGVILGFFSLKTMLQMTGEMNGAGLAGAFVGFLIFGGLSGWLIYCGIKGNKKTEE